MKNYFFDIIDLIYIITGCDKNTENAGERSKHIDNIGISYKLGSKKNICAAKINKQQKV